MTAISRSRLRPTGAGVAVPAWSARAALCLLLLALAGMHALDAWGWIAALAAIAAAVTPWAQLAWVAMLSLALSELIEPAGAAHWRPYLMLAGIALAHTLAARVVLIPPSARVSLRILGRPLLVAGAVVAPCEALLALALWLRATPHATWLPAALIAALALLGLGALLFARLLRSAE